MSVSCTALSAKRYDEGERLVGRFNLRWTDAEHTELLSIARPHGDDEQSYLYDATASTGSIPDLALYLTAKGRWMRTSLFGDKEEGHLRVTFGRGPSEVLSNGKKQYLVTAFLDRATPGEVMGALVAEEAP